MPWTKVALEHVELMDRLMLTRPRVVKRPLFGCRAYFVNGNMVAGAHQENIILRLAPEDREALLVEPGAASYTPMPGRTMKEYVAVPAAIYESEVAFRPWIDKARQGTPGFAAGATGEWNLSASAKC